MSFVTHSLGNSLIVEATGRITIGNGDVTLRETIEQAVTEGHRSIVVDFSEVKTLDSSGAGELVAAHLLLRRLGGQLALAALTPRVGGVLAATRLTGLLEIHPSIESAVLELAA